MSTTWALMSTRPSSNTANRPAGPPPMIRASVSMGVRVSVPSAVIGTLARLLKLLFGDTDDKAVQLLRHLDLAGQPALRAHLEGEVQHVLLHLAGRPRAL